MGAPRHSLVGRDDGEDEDGACEQSPLKQSPLIHSLPSPSISHPIPIVTLQVVGCANNTKGQPRPKTTKKGIELNRAYAVVTGGDFEDRKLMRLRIPLSPNGLAKEWNGKWSDTSGQWSGRMMQMLHYSRDENDGTFWMEYPDFCKHFNKVGNAQSRIESSFPRLVLLPSPHLNVPLTHLFPASPIISPAVHVPHARRLVDALRGQVALDGRDRWWLHELHLMAEQQPGQRNAVANPLPPSLPLCTHRPLRAPPNHLPVDSAHRPAKHKVDHQAHAA